MKKITVILILMLLLAPVAVTHAQAEIIMAASTMPVNAEIKDAVQAALAAAPPADTLIYAITNVNQNYSAGTIVSVVGLVDVEAPYTSWSMEEPNDVIWIGTVLIYPDGHGELYDIAERLFGQVRSRETVYLASFIPDGGPMLAGPLFGEGGGANISFPFQSGKRMEYGVRGVHGQGEFGITGGVAVDLVGGDTMGADVASSTMYGAADGAVTWVCRDDNNVGIKVTNASDDLFLYLHLKDATNLAEGLLIHKGVAFGSLVYGPFQNDGCGWASQQATSYHLHWMFVPSGGYYQVEGWVLSTSTKKWTSGSNVVSTGGWLTGGGGSGIWTPPDPEDPSTPPPFYVDPTDPSSIQMSGMYFWDYVIVGVYNIIAAVVFPILPPAGTSNHFIYVEQALVTAIKMTNVLLVGVLNFRFALVVMGVFVLGEILHIAYAIYRLIKKLFPGPA